MEAHGAEKSLRMKNNLGPLVPGSLSKQKKEKILSLASEGNRHTRQHSLLGEMYNIYI